MGIEEREKAAGRRYEGSEGILAFTATLGMCRNGREYEKALKEAGCATDPNSREILRSREFRCAPAGTTIELVALTHEQLGFSSQWSMAPTLGEITEAALERGYELCPPEAAPAILLQKSLYGDGNVPFSSAAIVSEPLFPPPHAHPSIFRIMFGEMYRGTSKAMSRKYKAFLDVVSAEESGLWIDNDPQPRKFLYANSLIFAKKRNPSIPAAHKS